MSQATTAENITLPLAERAVRASKFWHFLNPDAFVLEDSRGDRFFGLTRPNSVGKYFELLRRFEEFTTRREDWLPVLRAADRGEAWNDVKLWDKAFYGAYEP